MPLVTVVLSVNDVQVKKIGLYTSFYTLFFQFKTYIQYCHCVNAYIAHVFSDIITLLMAGMYFECTYVQ